MSPESSSAPSAAGPPPPQAPTSALRTTFPVLLGYLPLGIAFGVLLTASGLPWWWAPIWSVLMYGGSMQFLMVGLVTSGASLAQVAVATIAVNFRHVFYGLSFPMGKVHGRAARLYSAHALTDEAYALIASLRRTNVTSGFITRSQLLCHLYWVGGSTLGAVAGSGLGLRFEGLEFVLTALFAVLAIDAYRASRDRLVLGVSLVCGVAGAVLLGGGMLVPTLTVFSVLLVADFRRRHG